MLAAVFDPYVKMANALPRVVLAPIFMLWLGLGIWSKVALGVTLVFFIVFFNVYQGVKEVSPVVLANARLIGMNERQLFRNVYWPSALSWMFSSLHTSVGFALVGAVVGEYLGSAAGLGYLIHQAEGVFDTTGVFAGMFILAAFVLVMDWCRHAASRTGCWSGARKAPPASHEVSRELDNKETQGRKHETRPPHSRRLRLGDRACARSPRRRPWRSRTSTLGVGGKPLLYYLPLTLAERLGYFKEQG